MITPVCVLGITIKGMSFINTLTSKESQHENEGFDYCENLPDSISHL